MSRSTSSSTADARKNNSNADANSPGDDFVPPPPPLSTTQQRRSRRIFHKNDQNVGNNRNNTSDQHDQHDSQDDLLNYSDDDVIMTDVVTTDNDYGATSNTNDDGINNSNQESTQDSVNTVPDKADNRPRLIADINKHILPLRRAEIKKAATYNVRDMFTIDEQQRTTVLPNKLRPLMSSCSVSINVIHTSRIKFFLNVFDYYDLIEAHLDEIEITLSDVFEGLFFVNCLKQELYKKARVTIQHEKIDTARNLEDIISIAKDPSMMDLQETFNTIVTDTINTTHEITSFTQLVKHIKTGFGSGDGKRKFLNTLNTDGFFMVLLAEIRGRGDTDPLLYKVLSNQYHEYERTGEASFDRFVLELGQHKEINFPFYSRQTIYRKSLEGKGQTNNQGPPRKKQKYNQKSNKNYQNNNNNRFDNNNNNNNKNNNKNNNSNYNKTNDNNNTNKNNNNNNNNNNNRYDNNRNN